MTLYNVKTIAGDTVLNARTNSLGTLAARVPGYAALKSGSTIEGRESDGGEGIVIQFQGRPVMCGYEIYSAQANVAGLASLGEVAR